MLEMNEVRQVCGRKPFANDFTYELSVVEILCAIYESAGFRAIPVHCSHNLLSDFTFVTYFSFRIACMFSFVTTETIIVILFRSHYKFTILGNFSKTSLKRCSGTFSLLPSAEMTNMVYEVKAYCG